MTNICSINIKWVDTEKIESLKKIDKVFEGVDGIIIPGGFGYRGIEGKILSSKYARENNIPFLGICLGLQCAVIDFARNVCALQNANSKEFNSIVKHPVIDMMSGQKKVKVKGASMRLGSYSCNLLKGTKARKAYKKNKIYERHRHRYEVNNKYIDILKKNGLIISGRNKELDLVEIVELEDHPWFVGVQFHPESIASVAGYRILAQFLDSCGHKVINLDKLDQLEAQILRLDERFPGQMHA